MSKDKLLFWIQRKMTRAPEEFVNYKLWRGYLIALNDIRKYIEEVK